MLMAMRLWEPSVLMYGERGDDAIHRGLFDEQRLAAAGLFHFAIGEFGDLQFGGDRLSDAFEFTRFFELPHEVTEGFKCHSARRLAEAFRLANRGVSGGYGTGRTR